MAPFFRPCWVLQAMPSNGIDTSSATVGLEKNQSLSPVMRLLRGPAAPVPMLHSPMLSLTCSWRCKAEKCAIPVNRLTIAIQVGFGFVTFSFWSCFQVIRPSNLRCACTGQGRVSLSQVYCPAKRPLPTVYASPP